jgi:DNA replication protein DnaC
MNSNQATLEKMSRLGLWGMVEAYRKSMEPTEQSDWSADELVSRLVDAEWDRRQGRRLTRLMKAAHFRYRAGLEDIDFGLHRNLDKNQVLRLADCKWIEERKDLIITGPCGSGKSFLASALGQQACLYGHAVIYFSASKLFEHLKLCKADGSYLRELSRISKRRLLVIDDFGLEVLDTQSRLMLLEVLEDRHGRTSSLFASQLPVSAWHQAIGDPTIGDAVCDRIVHTAHRIELKGDSVRKLYAKRPPKSEPEKKE